MAAAASETRDRLLDAASQTLRAEGFAATTARSIGRTGELNQALIFYHWGSVDELLLAALDRSVAARLAAYEEVLGSCTTVTAVLEALPQLYADDVESGHVDLLCELVAGGVARRDLGVQVAARVRPWTGLVETTMRRVLPGPLRRRLPVASAAHAVVAFYLGAELLGRLQGDRGLVEQSFRAAGRLAGVTSLRGRRRGRTESSG